MFCKLNSSSRISLFVAGYLLLQLTLFAFLGFNAKPERYFTADSSRYIELADSFTSQMGFRAKSGTVANPAPQEVFRTPGYPVIIATTKLLSAYDWLLYLVLLQIVLRAATFYLTLKIIQENINSTQLVTSVVAILYFLDIPTHIYTFQVMTETTFVFLLTLGCYLCTKLRSKYFLLGAVCFLTASAVRPSTLILIPALIFFLKCIQKQTLALTVLTVAISLAFLIPWAFRNYSILDTVTVSTAWEYNKYILGSAQKVASQHKISVEESVISVEKEFEGILATGVTYKEALQVLARNHPYNSSSFKAIKNLLLLLINVERSSITKLFGLPNTSPSFFDSFNQLSLMQELAKISVTEIVLVGMQLIFNFLVLLFAGWFVGVLVSRGDWKIVLFVVLLVVVPSVFLSIVPVARMRQSIEPILFLLAGQGFVTLPWAKVSRAVFVPGTNPASAN